MSASKRTPDEPAEEVLDTTSTRGRSVSGLTSHESMVARKERGRAQRISLPRKNHACLAPKDLSRDPIAILESQNEGRLPHLIPIRYGRMLTSPFAFFRGSAAIMARDLNQLPRTEIEAQLCGDAHISNFGFYGSPERQLMFDINDFDETIPGPWEWDVKRLAASVVLASRDNGHTSADAQDSAMKALARYTERIREFAGMSQLEVWYAHETSDTLIEFVSEKHYRKRFERKTAAAHARTHIDEAERVTRILDGKLRIVDRPPLLERLDEEEVETLIQPLFEKYLTSLQDDRRILVERFQYADAALRAGGVGSVGTPCYIIALAGNDVNDRLVLQLKSASASALARYVPKSRFKNEAHRVVNGQRLMQAASDIFLGWVRTASGREYYWRQLRDMKASVDPAKLSPQSMGDYGAICASLLARAHARSGDPVQIASYLGKGRQFNRAVAQFADAYADQTERDFEALGAAVRAGRIPAELGV